MMTLAQIKHVCQQNMYLSQSKTTPPRIKVSAQKKLFTLNFIQLIHKTCQIVAAFTNQCHCLHLHSQSLHLSHTQHSHPLHPHPQHISFIHCMNIQHYLEPVTFTSGVMRCHAIMICIDEIILCVFWFINLLEPITIHSSLHG
jgi:hypothetical protein